VPLPAARQTTNLEDQWFRTFQLSPQGEPSVWNDASEGRNIGEKFPRILPNVATSTSLLGSFTCRKFTTWDRRLYFLYEGRRAEEFFRPKNPKASAGFEPANSGTIFYKNCQHWITFTFVPCILILSKFYLFTNWVVLKTILKFTLKQLLLCKL
jgi:hypothetical protein